MPLLQKIFHTDRKRRQRSFRVCGKEASPLSPEKLTSYKWSNTPEFDPAQIRLVVFTDNDVAKKLRFDSKTINRVDTGQCNESTSAASCARNKVRGLLHPCQPDAGDRYQYVRGRPSPDEKLLAEMLFGSVAMSYKGSMTKVHSIKSPPQLMLSRVFQLTKVKPVESDQDGNDSISLYGGEGALPQAIRNPYQSESESIAHSIPVAIPANSSYHSQDEDSSDFSTSGSFMGPSPSPGSLSSGTATPNNSLHRRWLRNQLTSMEYVARKKSTDALSSTDSPIARKRKPKIGVSIVISLPETKDKSYEQFKTFFFSHFSLLEHHFLRLCDEIERVLVCNRKTLLKSSMEALTKFRSTIASLYSAPRIQQPIWLNMMSYPQQRSALCQQLVKLLICELDTHNNKHTNFFVARLLTAVLTHHLAWVPTVMPSDSDPSRAYLDKHSSSMMDSLAQSHPYNPLWAQLGDLYGAIGHPNKIARTVVVGRRAEVVCRLLYLLSYFIRCSEVHERDLHCNEFTVHFDPEGHVFTWSLSVDESTGGSGRDFEESTAVSDQSSATRTDSGFAEGHDALSRDNISFSILDDLPNPERIGETFGCQQCPSCLRGGGVELCKLGGARDGDDVSVQSDLRTSQESEDRARLDYQRMVECQSVCSSVTVVSDDSTASTVCDEVCTKVAGGDRGRTPVPADGVTTLPQRDTQECPKISSVSQDSRTKTIVELCRAGNSPDGMPAEAVLNPQENISGTSVIKVVKDVQYTSRVEHCVPVGRVAMTRSDSGDMQVNCASSKVERQNVPNSMEGNPCHCPGEGNKEVACNSMDDHASRTADGLDDSMRTCSECSVHSNDKLASRGDVVLERHCGVVRTLEYPSVFNNNLEEPSRSRHSSGHTEVGSKNVPLLRGISAVSECSLTSSTITCQSESTVADQEELPLAVKHSHTGPASPQGHKVGDSHFGNIGRSLLGGYSQHYVPNLALHGTQAIDLAQLEADMVSSAEHSVLDEPTAEAVCIVANTDKWTVELVSSENRHSKHPAESPPAQGVTTSHMVQTLLESLQSLSAETGRKMEADFYLMHLEDRLQEIYFSSLVLASYLERNPGATTKELASNLGMEVSDFQLLLSVTSVHSPHVILGVLRESYENQRSSPGMTPPSSLSSNPAHA